MSAIAMHKHKTDKFSSNVYNQASAEEDRSSTQSSPAAIGRITITELNDRSISPVSADDLEYKKVHDFKKEDQSINKKEEYLESSENQNIESRNENEDEKDEKYSYLSSSERGHEHETKETTEQTDSITPITSPCMESPAYQFTSTLHQNLVLLMRSQLFTDVIVLVTGQKFPGHKIVLAASSGYFYRKFLTLRENGEYLKSHLPTIVDLHNFVSICGYTNVLDCMYSSQVNIKKENIKATLATAKYLEMPILVKACIDAIDSGYSSNDKSSCDSDEILGRKLSNLDAAMDLTTERKSSDADRYSPKEDDEEDSFETKMTHLKKYHNFLSHKTKKKLDHETQDFPQDGISQRNEQPNISMVMEQYNRSRELLESGIEARNASASVPQLIAPFTMARAAVLAMASQFQRFPQIAAPTPVLPFVSNIANSFGYPPYAPTHNGHRLPSKSREETRASDITFTKLDYNLLLELNAKRSLPQASSSSGGFDPSLPSAKPIAYTENTSQPKSSVKSAQPKPYKCLVCSAEFNRPANLKTHMRIHSGEKPYRCDACGSRFVQVAHLRAHALIHTGEKPYQCKICGTRFRHLQTLKSHIRIHTGEKPYSCDECKVQFRHKSQLRLHLRTKHGINTNTKKTYQHVPGLRSDHISAHIKRTQELIRVNQQLGRTLADETTQY